MGNLRKVSWIQKQRQEKNHKFNQEDKNDFQRLSICRLVSGIVYKSYTLTVCLSYIQASRFAKLLPRSITFENDLHKAANLDVSLGEIRVMLHPSVEALAVLPLL